jgi:succinate-semialdehyde dehydrogenase/glutarate-semialdehyde dehydrogenase
MISEKDLLSKVPTQLYIDGAWVDATGGKTIPVTDPATGEVLAHIADAQPEDGIRCLDAAVAAQDAWAQTAPRVANCCAKPSTACTNSKKSLPC